MPPQGGPPPQAQGWSGGGGTRSPICLELEQRLVQEGQRGNESRSMLPMVENEIRRVEQENRPAQQQLDRECYEYFLFSKTLRRTRKCVDLSTQVEEGRRRIADLEAQQRQLSSGRSYQDDIVRELARNNCGPAYQQQARRHTTTISIWNDEESSGGGMGGSFGSLPYATYRTVCVRLCDGYYFPISFSTLPNHFERDAEACSSKCAAPAELYYYQNPGGSPDQMSAARTNELYTQLKSAFRYRKEYVQGCSCKITEYVPEAGAPQQHGAATPGAGRIPRFRRARVSRQPRLRLRPQLPLSAPKASRSHAGRDALPTGPSRHGSSVTAHLSRRWCSSMLPRGRGRREGVKPERRVRGYGARRTMRTASSQPKDSSRAGLRDVLARARVRSEAAAT